MARKYLTSLDLSGNELLNARLQNLATAPAHAVGRAYFDTTLGYARVSDGVDWTDLDGSLDATAVQTIVANMVNGGSGLVVGSGPSISVALPNGYVTGAMIADGAITNADVSGTAGIRLDKLAETASLKIMTSAERTKLAGIATGATANAKDAQLRNRSTHTGTQLHTTISDFDAGVQANRLDQMATPTSIVSMGGQRIWGLADPLLDSDAATKGYVDAAIEGLTVLEPVKVASTANRSLSTGGSGSIDGVSVKSGDRVLLKNQATASENGIYEVQAPALVKIGTEGSAPGSFVFVEQGTVNADTGWINTADDSGSAQAWVQFSSAGVVTAGAGLTKTGNTIGIATGGVATAMIADLAVTDAKINTVRGTKIWFGLGDHITNTNAPAAGSDLTNKTYVDAQVATKPTKYSQTLTTSATSYTITHNLNSRDVLVQVYLNSGTYEEVEVDVQHTSVNVVTLLFATAPAANAYRVVVHG